MPRLTTDHHPSEAPGLTYVYAVVSRRAGGVSVGVNLNPNKACNWACVYCQVDGLVRGAAPPIDLARLEAELDGFLCEVRTERWLFEHAPEGARRLQDIAFSGDGESTTAREFDAAVDCVARVLERQGLLGALPVVLITNGSQVAKPHVQRGLARLAAAGGVVWFKLDRGTRAGRQVVNHSDASDAEVEANLRRTASLCPTRIQTCMFALDGAPPSEDELEAWLGVLRRAVDDGVPLVDVMLYGLARPSHQPEAPRLARLDRAWLEALAARVEALGLRVSVHP